MPLELTGPQFKPLNEALRRVFKLSAFDMMLTERLDKDRESYALGDNYKQIVHLVIQGANQEGWVYQLVDAAREERPNEPVFVEYARLLGIGPRALPAQVELERIIKKSNSMLDIAPFLARLGAIAGRVCRVDLKGEGYGTGFLVGPDIVMTNYHVIEGIIKKKYKEQDFSCRFDFKMREDGTSLNDGTSYPVTKVIAYSPYDPADLNKSGPPPDASNLDYALLRLDGEPGSNPIGDKATESSAPRGWITLQKSEHPFEEKSPLFIVQHPNKEPMKLALESEAVLGLNGNKTRVEYTTNTEPGSSGSPCFNQNWDLVALHHSGDPKWEPKWNQGIPITLIYEHLQRAELGPLLDQPLPSEEQ